jgi:hypothetical protein
MNSIANDEGFPLPATDLYNPAAPEAGLLALLKAAVWQLAWTDISGPQKGWSAGEAFALFSPCLSMHRSYCH